MRKKRFQNKVATSGLTLPVAALVATILWWGEGTFTLNQLWGWMLCGVNACLWIETNNKNTLIRIRSRLTPALYLIMCGALFFLHPFQDGAVVSCCMLASYYLLFQSYQRTDAVFPFFHSFLCLGIGSLFFVQALYFVPFYLWYAAVYLRSLSWRTFWAAVIGLLLPYWFMAGYCLYAENFGLLTAHLSGLAQFQPLCKENYLHPDYLQASAVALIILLSLTGAVHYLRTSFNDKIRTRMLLYLILTQEVLIVLFLALQPVHFRVLAALLVMNSAPIMGHYFALTNRRFSNFLFILALFMFGALAILNLWTQLLTF